MARHAGRKIPGETAARPHTPKTPVLSRQDASALVPDAARRLALSDEKKAKRLSVDSRKRSLPADLQEQGSPSSQEPEAFSVLERAAKRRRSRPTLAEVLSSPDTPTLKEKKKGMHRGSASKPPRASPKPSAAQKHEVAKNRFFEKQKALFAALAKQELTTVTQ